MVSDGCWKCQGNHFVKYMIVYPPCCTPETNINNIKCELELKNKILNERNTDVSCEVPPTATPPPWVYIWPSKRKEGTQP